MIKDSLKNSALYENIHPRFKKAFDYLKSLKELNAGKVFIDGEDLFVNNLPDSALKDIDHSKWENHQKYIDIQYIFKGKEKFGVCDVNLLKKGDGYDAAKDIEFYLGNDSHDIITMYENDFIILFPQDAHLPARKMLNSEKADRVIVKVKI